MAIGPRLLMAFVATFAPSAAQDEVALRDLSMDALIARLPANAADEWSGAQMRGSLDAACQEMRRRLRQGEAMTDAQWRAALERARVIKASPRWPSTIPWAISMRIPAWLEECRITATPLAAGMHAASAEVSRKPTCGNYENILRAAERFQLVGILPEGRHALTFRIRVERASRFDDATILWEGAWTLEAEFFDPARSATPPKNSPFMDDAVRRSLRLLPSAASASKSSAQESGLLLQLAPDARDAAAFPSTPVYFALELRRDGIPVEFTAIEWDSTYLASTSTTPDARAFTRAIAALQRLPRDVWTSITVAANFSLRIQGPLSTERSFEDDTTVWSGTLEIPLEEMLTRR